ncbi:cation transporter [Rhizobium laguerreae]
MSCASCVARIERAIKAFTGVDTASVTSRPNMRP